MVLEALVWGFPESDAVHNWPRFFEWHRPGYAGPLQALKGYARAWMELTIAPGGPN